MRGLLSLDHMYNISTICYAAKKSLRVGDLKAAKTSSKMYVSESINCAKYLGRTLLAGVSQIISVLTLQSAAFDKFKSRTW